MSTYRDIRSCGFSDPQMIMSHTAISEAAAHTAISKAAAHTAISEATAVRDIGR